MCTMSMGCNLTDSLPPQFHFYPSDLYICIHCYVCLLNLLFILHIYAFLSVLFIKGYFIGRISNQKEWMNISDCRITSPQLISPLSLSQFELNFSFLLCSIFTVSIISSSIMFSVWIQKAESIAELIYVGYHALKSKLNHRPNKPMLTSFPLLICSFGFFLLQTQLKFSNSSILIYVKWNKKDRKENVKKFDLQKVCNIRIKLTNNWL